MVLYLVYYLLVSVSFYGLGVLGGKAGRAMAGTGILVHLAFVANRAALLGTLPVTERLDTLSLIGLLMMLMYLYIEKRWKVKGLEYYLIPLACFIVFTALFHQPVDSVSQFMRTPWFYAFSVMNIVGYAMLGAGTALGALYFFGGNGGDGGGGDERLEALQYRYLYYGWAAFSASLLAGSVWFFLAYGSYWYWSAKELWASLTWFYYALYLHARLLGGLRGRPAALIGALGYPLMLFTYFGIGTVVKSPWTQF